MKEFGGYLFSDTNEIDGLLLDALSEGYFDSFLEQHTFEKKALMQQIAQSQEDGDSGIICVPIHSLTAAREGRLQAIFSLSQ